MMYRPHGSKVASELQAREQKLNSLARRAPAASKSPPAIPRTMIRMLATRTGLSRSLPHADLC